MSLTPTIWIRQLGGNQKLLRIPPASFDASLHEKLPLPDNASFEVAQAFVASGRKKLEPVTQINVVAEKPAPAITREALVKMSAGELRRMPQLAGVDMQKMRSKDDLINAILGPEQK